MDCFTWRKNKMGTMAGTRVPCTQYPARVTNDSRSRRDKREKEKKRKDKKNPKPLRRKQAAEGADASSSDKEDTHAEEAKPWQSLFRI
jgi:hypothetical protein